MQRSKEALLIQYRVTPRSTGIVIILIACGVTMHGLTAKGLEVTGAVDAWALAFAAGILLIMLALAVNRVEVGVGAGGIWTRPRPINPFFSTRYPRSRIQDVHYWSSAIRLRGNDLTVGAVAVTDPSGQGSVLLTDLHGEQLPGEVALAIVGWINECAPGINPVRCIAGPPARLRRDWGFVRRLSAVTGLCLIPVLGMLYSMEQSQAAAPTLVAEPEAAGPAQSDAESNQQTAGHHLIAFSPDGKRIAAVLGKQIEIHDVESQKMILEIKNPVWAMTPVFAPDGVNVGVGGSDGEIRWWDSRTGVPSGSMAGPQSPVLAIAFHPGGARLSTVYAKGNTRVWDLATPAQVAYADSGGAVAAAAISVDGKLLAVRGADPMVRIVAIDAGHIVHEIKSVAAANPLAGAMAFSSDGSLLAIGLPKAVEVWNLRTGERRARFEAAEDVIGSIAFAPGANLLAWGANCSSTPGAMIEMWSLDRNVRLAAEYVSPAVGSVAFSPDGELLAVLIARSDCDIHYYRVSGGTMELLEVNR